MMNTEQKYKKEADKQFSPSNVLFSHRMKLLYSHSTKAKDLANTVLHSML